MNKIIAVVGMCGAGKSIVSDEFTRAGFQYLRFGQITLDEVIRRKLAPNEKLEKEIRDGFRAKHGMAAFAILNAPKLDQLLDKGNVVVDGLYSWSEYKYLKKKYQDKLITVAIYSPPSLRYKRLDSRLNDSKLDPNLRFRRFTKEEAKNRDYIEIEKVEKGGPIAMADHTILNTSNLANLKKQIKQIIKTL